MLSIFLSAVEKITNGFYAEKSSSQGVNSNHPLTWFMLTTNDRRDARPCVSTISCVSTVCVVFLHFYMLLLFNFIHFSSLLYIIANQSCGFLRHIFLPFFTNHPQGPLKRCTQSKKKMRQPPKKHKQVLLKT